MKDLITMPQGNKNVPVGMEQMMESMIMLMEGMSAKFGLLEERVEMLARSVGSQKTEIKSLCSRIRCMDNVSLRSRKIKWCLIPADSRETVIPYLNVRDLANMFVAMSSKETREAFLKSFETNIPAFDNYMFTNKDNFAGIAWVRKMKVDLRQCNLKIVDDASGGSKESPSAVLRWLVEQEHTDIASYFMARNRDAVDLSAPWADEGHFVHEEIKTLYVATTFGMTEIVHNLMERGADADEVQRAPALYNAAFSGFTGVIRELLDFGASIDLTDVDLFTPLFAASQNGHLDAVNLLLERGADPSISTNESGFSPLHISCMCNHIEVAKVLLDAGTDIDKLGNGDETPLFIAAENDCHEVVSMLMERGADPTLTDIHGFSPLRQCARKNLVQMVGTLLDGGGVRININEANGSGNAFPLYIAAIKGRRELLQLLLERGADVNLANADGHTALHCSSEKGYGEVVEVLLSHGAIVDKVDNHEITPLHKAANFNHPATVTALCTRGADMNKADSEGTTPLFVASEQGYTGVVEVLTEWGADTEKAAPCGKTPLIIAALGGHHETVSALLQSGADVEKVDSDGKTALDVARDRQHTAVTWAIFNHLASSEPRASVASPTKPGGWFRFGGP